MPINHSWFLPERIVLVHMAGIMTLDEIRDAFAESARYVESSSARKVHLLHDWRDLKRFPRNVMEIRRVLLARIQNPRKIGWVVMFGTMNPLARFLMDMAMQTFRIRFRAFNTPEEALAFLRKMDASLPEMSAEPLYTEQG
jgi:hypothetical protein